MTDQTPTPDISLDDLFGLNDLPPVQLKAPPPQSQWKFLHFEVVSIVSYCACCYSTLGMSGQLYLKRLKKVNDRESTHSIRLTEIPTGYADAPKVFRTESEESGFCSACLNPVVESPVVESPLPQSPQPPQTKD